MLLSAIVSVYSFVSLPAELLAVKLTVNVPPTLGTPVSLPDVFSDNPSGSPLAVHVIGDVPSASSVALYIAPLVPFGSEAVFIVGAVTSATVDFTLSVNFRESLPAEFAAVIVKLCSPVCLGAVPETVAVPALNVSHEGSPAALHVIGAVPVASIVFKTLPLCSYVPKS